MRLKVLAASSMVLVLGGALLVINPALANPGDLFCSVEVAPDPSASPSPGPTTSPTPCPTLLVTVTITKTNTRIVHIIKTVTVRPKPTTYASSSDARTSAPSQTPSPAPPAVGSSDTRSLISWGAGVAVVISVILMVVGMVNVVRRRRYQGSHQAEDEVDYDHVMGDLTGKSGLDLQETMETPMVTSEGDLPQGLGH